MALLPFVDPQAASDDTRKALSVVPPTSTVFRIVAHADASFRPWLTFGGTLSRGLELRPTLRQIAIMRVAILADCEYELVWHEAISIVDGVRREQVDALLAGQTDGDEFDELEQLVLRFVSECVTSLGAGEQTTRALLELLSPRAAVELMLVVSHYLGLAILLRSLQVEAEPPLSAEDIREARRRRGEL